MKRTFTLLLSAIFLASCSGELRHADTSGISINVKVDPFYKKMFAPQTDIDTKAESLQAEYPNLFDFLCRYELRLGVPGTERFRQQFQTFLSIPENAEVLLKCDSVFDHIAPVNKTISEGFSRFRYFFPSKDIPEIYCHISGFNSKICMDSTFISFSIEHYLGKDCRFYPLLEIPVYARQNKTPGNIAPDVIKAWIYGNYPNEGTKGDVLEEMVYQGKVLYALRCCLPDLPLHTAMGYTEEQLEWCRKAEAQMWGYMAEEKLLYDDTQLTINKLTRDAPFTTYFSNQSPGRAALYCGYNIVSGYMNAHEDVSLEQLMLNHDAQSILVGSHYQP